MANLKEHLQKEQSLKEHELKEKADNHESQIRGLQEKISTLVNIAEQTQTHLSENSRTHGSGKFPIYYTWLSFSKRLLLNQKVNAKISAFSFSVL